MKYNTRFNPTITGPLHIGHLYLALVNANEAHRTGGKFIVRADDTQDYWNHWIKKDQQDAYYEDYQEQLGLFMDVDIWARQSEMLTSREIIGDNPHLECLLPKNWGGMQKIEWRSNANMRVFQYEFSIVIEKVIWDYWQKVNLLIRGEDLITEAQFYEHLTFILRLPTIRQIYLPKLFTVDSQDNIRSTISKSERTYSLETQLNAFGAEETLYLLRKACLIDPDGEFLVDNIKSNPIAKGFKA